MSIIDCIREEKEMYKLEMKCIVTIIVVFNVFVANARPATDTVWHDHDGRIETGLYGPNDHVFILNSTNLKDTIYGDSRAWLVEFYANWCPHCQRFAPIWKTFSHSIDNWKDIVNVGVFDCATVPNTPICQEYKVGTVPAIKYFHPHSEPGTLGELLSKSEIVELLRQKTIRTLENDREHRNDVSWPEFTYLKELELGNIFNGLPMHIKYYFIFFEEPVSYLGLTAILDFHNVSQITIRRVSSNNDQICRAFKVEEFPTLIVIDRENIPSTLSLSSLTRTAVFNAMKKFLNSRGIDINMKNITDDAEIMQIYKPKRPSNRPAITLKDDDIHHADLEAALQYSLKQEIGLAKTIDGEKMEALKDYLEVLSGYFPMKFGPPAFLDDIYGKIKNETSIDGEEFHMLVTSPNINPDRWHELTWVGCKGSEPHKRGYTCGLWTMFHTLTVRYAIAADRNQLKEDAGAKVILAMYGYAKHFFGCSHCAEHFVHMAESRKINDVKSADEAVLWLWKAHNEVNERLAGDVTEDPEYPKIQYPVKEHCSKCKNADNSWNELEVLKYLKEKYGGPRIKDDLPASSSQ